MGRNLSGWSPTFYGRERPRRTPEVGMRRSPCRVPFIHGNQGSPFEPGGGGDSQSYWSNRSHFGLERYSADCERVDCRGRSRKTSVSTVLRKCDLWPWNSGNKEQRAWAAFTASWASAVVTSLAKIWECPFDRMDSNKADHMKSHHVSECEGYTL